MFIAWLSKEIILITRTHRTLVLSISGTRLLGFLVQKSNSVFAIEVKTKENLQSKSLRAFKESHPDVEAIRFSLSGYREQGWMKNIPLYVMTNVKLWR